MKDTITAISTALGVGAISIIRISGDEAINIANSIFKGKDLTKVDSHTIHYGHIVDEEETIDEVLLSIMRAPKTFTCEDIIEINCHGGIATTNKILELILLKGARLAEPGEFTKRAFLNGRIDLIEAESVMDLIDAKTEQARKLSINQLDGKVSEIIKKFRKKLLELLASIEVNIDYPEYEEYEVITNENIKKEINYIKNELLKIIKESENGKIIRNGIKVAIVGRPNVGKSSILNRFLDEEKAIVTDIAGTTRDIVEGQVSLDGILFNFVDTAGIREATDIVEQIGIERSKNEINSADLVLLVLNNNEELNSEDKQLIDELPKNSIIVINKTDLENRLDIESIDREKVFINTVSLDGIEPLKEKIKEMFKLDQINNGDCTYLSNARQISLAKEAYAIINDIETGIQNEVPTDLIEIDIKRIWEKLGEILGETYTDELIDQLFTQFCLGK
ncbi:MAG: tRNA uridine-5-carboxymethylaminomethyl(34) synthesis GTPase MnmE [Bacilli bacterium]|nr:tRNA uridine-5-carboxymethylaminomethyl(34) synthesis GTPase MnmE [Bacilli bacterium]